MRLALTLWTNDPFLVPNFDTSSAIVSLTKSALPWLDKHSQAYSARDVALNINLGLLADQVHIDRAENSLGKVYDLSTAHDLIDLLKAWFLETW